MKFQFKKIAVIGCLLLSNTALAQQECSALFFGDETNSNKVIDIIAIDGEVVQEALHYSGKQARDIAKGNMPFYLGAGEHSLTVRVWDSNLFLSVNTDSKANNMDKGVHQAYLQNLRGENLKQSNAFKKNLLKLEGHYEEKTIQVKLQNDKRYNFTLTESNNIDSRIALLSEDNQECHGEGELLAEAKEYERLSGLLPSRLEDRLQSVMSSLNTYHSKKQLDNTNLVPKKAYEYFGTVLDTSKSTNNGYKVLAVLPYSLAQKLTLISGDVITEFGGDKVSGKYANANQELVNYISTVPYGKKIEFTVLRNNRELNLSHRYTTSIIPQSSYTFESGKSSRSNTLFNSVPLPDNLEFRYEHLMLELTEYFKSQGYKKDVELQRQSRISHKLGLTGILEKEENGYVFLVTRIIPNSAASSLGVKVNDRIHSINGQNFKSDNKTFESIASALINDKQHNMLITRNNEKIRLQEHIQYPKTPAFSLKVAITSGREFLKRKYRDRRGNVFADNNNGRGSVNMHDSSSRASSGQGSKITGPAATKKSGN